MTIIILYPLWYSIHAYANVTTQHTYISLHLTYIDIKGIKSYYVFKLLLCYTKNFCTIDEPTESFCILFCIAFDNNIWLDIMIIMKMMMMMIMLTFTLMRLSSDFVWHSAFQCDIYHVSNIINIFNCYINIRMVIQLCIGLLMTVKLKFSNYL